MTTNPPPPPAPDYADGHRAERDKISGATFPQMGEWSRSCHLTQGMGKWREEPQTEWQLHLARVAKGEPAKTESDIREGLSATVGDIAKLDGMPASSADALRNAQGLIDEAIADVVVVAKAVEIAKAISEARKQLPQELRAQIAHRLERKAREIDLVLATASGMHIRAFTDGEDLKPGDSITIRPWSKLLKTL